MIQLSPADEIKILACDPGGPSIADLSERVFREVLGMDVREGQIRMARMVASTILDDLNGEAYSVEAPCGSGKGLAYLVPAVLSLMRCKFGHENHKARIVISTSNISLQQQLVEHDIPIIENALGNMVTVAVLKSIRNYACPERIAAIRVQRSHPSAQFADRVADWLSRGGSGDREAIPMDLMSFWDDVSTDSDGCYGPKCPSAATCPGLKARDVSHASIVIVNHAYLATSHERIFNGCIGLICDEAHDLEDTLRKVQGSRISMHRFQLVSDELDDLGLTFEASSVRSVGRNYINSALSSLGLDDECQISPGWIPDTNSVINPIDAAYRSAWDARAVMMDPVEKLRYDALLRKLSKLISDVSISVSASTHHCMTVSRSRSGSVCVSVIPLTVNLMGAYTHIPVVLASATIGDHDTMAQTLKVKLTARDHLNSPWPLQDMGVVVVPSGTPDFRSDLWDGWVRQKVVEFAAACGGGVLALSTSHRGMARLAEPLRAAGYNVRVQGESGRSDLIAWFKSERDSILVATRSFFQGVDVPGDSLRGVVLDKIPFPQPSIVETAIGEMIKKNGGDPFIRRTLFRAELSLKQAVGRLLRSSSDRGAVMILDRRMISGSFAVRLQRAVSPIPFSTSIDDVRHILNGSPLVSTRHVPSPRRGIKV